MTLEINHVHGVNYKIKDELQQRLVKIKKFEFYIWETTVVTG